jgi:hypothetical protein
VNTSKSILLLAFLLCIQLANAQYTEYRYKRKNHSTDEGYLFASGQTRYFSAGLGVNAHTYFGDLTPDDLNTRTYFGDLTSIGYNIKNALKITRPGISAFAMYNFNPVVFFMGELSYGRITGDDFNGDPTKSSTRKYVRNLHFRNDLIGLNLRANVNIFRDPFEFFKRRDFNMYLFSGITIFYSNPKAMVPATGLDGQPFENAGDWVALRPLGTEGQNHPDYSNKYSAVQLGIPFGGGIRFRLGYKTDIMIEGSLQYLLSDYIDDISSNYVDLGIFDNELAKALSDRSQEETAVLKGEMRNWQLIMDYTQEYIYESAYDGQTYSVFKGFGHQDGKRGGDRNDRIGNLSIKISYIFTN